MTTSITTSLTPEELGLLVENAVGRAINSEGKFLIQPNLESPITRRELISRLKVTEPTIIRWERKGKIPCLRIGNSVRYKWSDVIEALEMKKKGGRK